MNPGLLDRRITIQSRATTRDALGGAIVVYSDFRTVWASKEDRGGSEVGFAGALRREESIIFTIYYLTGLTTEHRIIFNGVAHDIVALQEIGRRRFQTVTCRIVEAAAA